MPVNWTSDGRGNSMIEHCGNSAARRSGSCAAASGKWRVRGGKGVCEAASNGAVSRGMPPAGRRVSVRSKSSPRDPSTDPASPVRANSAAGEPMASDGNEGETAEAARSTVSHAPTMRFWSGLACGGAWRRMHVARSAASVRPRVGNSPVRRASCSETHNAASRCSVSAIAPIRDSRICFALRATGRRSAASTSTRAGMALWRSSARCSRMTSACCSEAVGSWRAQ